MRIYVGNLPLQINETDLQEWFSQAGVAVDAVNLVRDRFSGELRGFGFVDVNDQEQAELAIRNCNGKEMHGRSLVVNEARPMGERGGGRGGPRGGGRGPRGGGGGRGRW